MQASSMERVIDQCPLFAESDALTRAQLVSSARRRQLAANDLLLIQGSAANSMFIIESGMLRVYTSSEQGDEQTLTMVFAGDTVGELGALDGGPRAASIAATCPTTVIELPASVLRQAYAADPAIARALVTQMAGRLRTTSERLGDMVVLDLPSRLAKYLVGEVRRQLDELPRHAEIALPFTQAQLGLLLGGGRQTINRELADLELGGLIRLDGRRVEICDLDGLQRRCRGER